ncbi:probable LRR receptor-like serine/threonine-protein kinase At2g24230 [Punica granatum]|uniref:Probable LRR receptor-like serine/threonine-protein kinase At2g24230 n=1 Tax=Punica granatum TaxID=22663 RepID=A0A6P8CJV2_PUNGR|nr:probable LRR receptor-like serine/threonine-protein kinase At2g24230 [Punica granatum]
MGVPPLGCCILFLAVFMFISPLGSSQLPNTDGFFVSDFFQKMGLSLTSFGSSAPVCSWRGVSCDANGEFVLQLNASNFNLSGSIPDTTIGKLTKLQSLDLSGNRITGLPSDFWSLGSLQSLNLSNNLISGSLPSNVGNFGSLESIDLSGNNFSGEIPEAVSSLRNLQVLKLDSNGFESDLPFGILSCRSLVLLDLSSNRLSGSLPMGFGSALPKLETLNLAGNAIEGRDADLSGMKSMKYLNVSRNLFRGSVMGFLTGTYEVVDLSRNQFSGHTAELQSNISSNWSRLVFLDLSENQLSGEILHSFSEAQNLRYLNLAGNRFTHREFPRVEVFSGLEFLNLSKANLIGEIPSEISQLSNLKSLDLSDNHLTGRIPVLSIRSLESLDLSRNNLSGEIPPPIVKKLPYMEKYNFSFNNLTLCASDFKPETIEKAFFGSTNSCPIAANPALFLKKNSKHKGMTKLALALTLSIMCLLLGLLFLVFGCRRKNKSWAVKQASYKEEQQISGPFSFQTDSTTWVADVKQATSVPVVIFEKPLLNITFADLLSATSNFDRGTLLAEGKFGPVYRGFLPGGVHVAVKVLVHGSTLTDHEAARELEYLGRIKHPNLVPLTGYCLAGEQRIAIYDYMENGNLHSLLHDLPLGVNLTEDWSNDTWEDDYDGNNSGIRNVGPGGILMTWRFRHRVALGTARALAFLHHGCFPSIIHRDVKASSVYLDYNLEPRLSDFGLAKVFGNELDEEIARGCPGYFPPEFSEPGETPTAKSDVYCFGVVLFELITGKKPVGDDYPEVDASNLVSWVRGFVRKSQGSRVVDPKIRDTGPDDQMEEALKIGYLCTADHPSKRPSMQQVVGLLKDMEPVN